MFLTFAHPNTDPDINFQNRITEHAPAEALPPTVLRKILNQAQLRRADSTELELDPNLDTPTLVSMVKQHRHETSARERARRFTKAVLAIRLYGQ